MIVFPVTYKCNLSCEYCSFKNTTEPDIDKCLGLIKKTGKNRKWVYITGGEPLLVENLKEICLKLRSFGKNVGITTNGTIFNKNLHEFTDRVGVSIDGDKEFHNKYRQGSFDKAVKFLKYYIGKVETVIMFTLFPGNAHLVESVEELGKTIGVDNLQITKGVL